MNPVLRAAYELYEGFERSETFSDALDPPTRPLSDLAGALDDALQSCARHRNDLLTLACLLVAQRSGLLDGPDRTGDLFQTSRLCQHFGLYEASIATCRKAAAHADPQLAKEVALTEAKARRGLGQYEAAQAIYRSLLHESAGDALWEARLLLNLAKVTHNDQWRNGYYRAMIKIVFARLEILASAAPDDPLVLHWLGICHDAIASIEFEFALSAPETIAAERSDITQAFHALETAILLGERTPRYNSLLRRQLRSLYFKFRVTPDPAERDRLCDQFEELIPRLGSSMTDPRGLGLRYSQLAEMLAAVGRHLEAADAIHLALMNARRVSDWRVLVRTHLRAARMIRAQNGNHGLVEQHLGAARKAIDRLDGQHPELELDIDREEAHQFLRAGKYDQSLERLEHANSVLLRLETRVARDVELHTTADFRPEERRTLTSDEWSKLTASLVTDYQLVSAQLRANLQQMATLAQNRARAEGLESQIDFLVDYQRGWHHRLKNLMVLSNRHVLGVLRDTSLATPAMRGPVELLANTLNQVREWAEETQHDIDLLERNVAQPRSMREAIESIRIHAEKVSDPSLKVLLEPDSPPDDFYLRCHGPLLNQAITHLVENAARVVSEHGSKDHQVTLRIQLRRNASGAATGVFEIEDTAGRAELLRAALRTIDGNERPLRALSKGVSGLYLACRFFRRFSAKSRVEERPSGKTALIFEFTPDGHTVLTEAEVGA
jgi:hypothetical protein